MKLLAVVAGFALLGACADGEEASTEGTDTTEPILLLSAEEVGPSAFTPPVDTAPLEDAPTGACDAQALIAELDARPDARREWAAVLEVPEDQVDAYIASLEPGILGADTRVTNHGFRDGEAFPLQATLTSGTAVLVDTSGGTQRPVTRCKCGNPLLPPVDVAVTTTSTYYDTTTTYYDTTSTTYYDDTTTTEYDPTPSEPEDDQPEPEPEDDGATPVD